MVNRWVFRAFMCLVFVMLPFEGLRRMELAPKGGWLEARKHFLYLWRTA